jgi:hypothetical protein
MADTKRPAFEIKETGMTVKDRPLGEGLFLCDGEDDIPAGAWLTSLTFYGEFVLASHLDTKFPGGCPGYPGTFLLQKPLEQYAMVIDPRCPAAKINDPRGTIESHHALYIIFTPHSGTDESVNVEVSQDEMPATLYMTGKLHQLLAIRTVKKIKKGEQIFMDYGDVFWKKTKYDDNGLSCSFAQKLQRTM